MSFITQSKIWHLNCGTDKEGIERILELLLTTIGIDPKKAFLSKEDIEKIVRDMLNSCYRIKQPRHEFLKGSQEYNKEVIGLLDKDRDGRVSMQEFKDYFLDRLSGNLTNSQPYLPFTRFDPMKSSLLSVRERRVDIRRSFGVRRENNTNGEIKLIGDLEVKKRVVVTLDQNKDKENEEYDPLRGRNGSLRKTIKSGFSSRDLEKSGDRGSFMRKSIKSGISNRDIFGGDFKSNPPVIITPVKKKPEERRDELRPFISFSQNLGNNQFGKEDTSEKSPKTESELNEEEFYLIKENINNQNLPIFNSNGITSTTNSRRINFEKYDMENHKRYYKEDFVNKESTIICSYPTNDNRLRLSNFKYHRMQINLNKAPKSDDSDMEILNSTGKGSQKSPKSKEKMVSFKDSAAPSRASVTSFDDIKPKERAIYESSLGNIFNTNDMNYLDKYNLSPEMIEKNQEEFPKSIMELKKSWANDPLRKSNYIRDYSQEREHKAFNSKYENLKNLTPTRNFKVNYGNRDRDATRAHIVEKRLKSGENNFSYFNSSNKHNNRNSVLRKSMYSPIEKSDIGEGGYTNDNRKGDIYRSCIVNHSQNPHFDYSGNLKGNFVDYGKRYRNRDYYKFSNFN